MATFSTRFGGQWALGELGRLSLNQVWEETEELASDMVRAPGIVAV